MTLRDCSCPVQAKFQPMQIKIDHFDWNRQQMAQALAVPDVSWDLGKTSWVYYWMCRLQSIASKPPLEWRYRLAYRYGQGDILFRCCDFYLIFRAIRLSLIEAQQVLTFRNVFILNYHIRYSPQKYYSIKCQLPSLFSSS